MLSLRALTFSLVAFCAGCAGGSVPQAAAARPPLRILSSEAPRATWPERAPNPTHSDTPHPDVAAPRIGAPGGSGAGSRRVRPLQSGKEAVGGLPTGRGGGAELAGRG